MIISHGEPVNRAARRQQRKEMPAWMRDKSTVDIVRAIGKNGITAQDLDKYYQKGLREGAQMESERLIRLFYAAAGWAAHDMYGFGAKRVAKLLHMMDQEIEMAIDDTELVKKLEEAVGYKLRVKGQKYTIDWEDETLSAIEG